MKPGQTTTANFQQAGAVVAGIVTENGKPCSHDSVEFSNPGVLRAVQTDYAGRFEISGLESGSYAVKVEPTWRSDKVIERTVEIPASGEIHLEFEYP